MDEDRFTFSEVDLAQAIRGLREVLGRSQEVMAQMVGCSLPAYQKWEMGNVIPAGEWLIRILRLCPDEEARNTFRIRAERRSAAREKRESLPPGPLTPAQRHYYRQVALKAVGVLCECGEAGLEAADARLLDFARNLEWAADYYRAQLNPHDS